MDLASLGLGGGTLFRRSPSFLHTAGNVGETRAGPNRPTRPGGKS
jgi:hypothetical protein